MNGNSFSNDEVEILKGVEEELARVFDEELEKLFQMFVGFGWKGDVAFEMSKSQAMQSVVVQAIKEYKIEAKQQNKENTEMAEDNIGGEEDRMDVDEISEINKGIGGRNKICYGG